MICPVVFFYKKTPVRCGPATNSFRLVLFILLTFQFNAGQFAVAYRKYRWRGTGRSAFFLIALYLLGRCPSRATCFFAFHFFSFFAPRWPAADKCLSNGGRGDGAEVNFFLSCRYAAAFLCFLLQFFRS